MSRVNQGKTPEEIRETFHLPDDLTEEEKLEPLKNVTDDPRIRLLNRLYAKKRRDLADKRALPAIEQVHLLNIPSFSLLSPPPPFLFSKYVY
jgi:S-phase kinase-associated protein 1